MIETERLTLRPFEETDGEGLCAYLSDEKVVHYEPYSPRTLAQCHELAQMMAAGNDFWAVCLKRDGTLIGQVYLAEHELFIWELGYVFHRAHWHKGYATEAVKALVDYTFREYGVHRMTANCNPENESSWLLLERAGFAREGHLRQNVYFHTDDEGNPIWQDTYVYGLLNPTE